VLNAENIILLFFSKEENVQDLVLIEKIKQTHYQFIIKPTVGEISSTETDWRSVWSLGRYDLLGRVHYQEQEKRAREPQLVLISRVSDRG